MLPALVIHTEVKDPNVEELRASIPRLCHEFGALRDCNHGCHMSFVVTTRFHRSHRVLVYFAQASACLSRCEKKGFRLLLFLRSLIQRGMS